MKEVEEELEALEEVVAVLLKQGVVVVEACLELQPVNSKKKNQKRVDSS